MAQSTSTSFRLQAIDLPFDVWLHIASFIPAEQLRTLYGVNRAFFNLAMNIRCKEVVLYQSGEEQVISRTVSRLKPHVHRIRTLNLCPDVAVSCLPPFRPKHYPKRRDTILKFFSKLRARDLASPAVVPTVASPAVQAVRFAESASDLVSGMSDVEELKIEELRGLSDKGVFSRCLICYGGRDFKDLEYILQTVITTGWATFGSTLRCLKLNLPHRCYSESAMPSTLVFPRLEELDITLSELDFLRDQVIPFINDHHSTLQILKLSFDKVASQYGVDACSYLPQIHHIPNLNTFHFYYHIITETDLNTSGLYTFLSTHSTGLQAFGLDLLSSYDHDDLYAQPVFRVVLPCLESLELGPGCYTNMEEIAAYLQQYAHSLTVLNLGSKLLLFREANVLLEVFKEHDKLRSLTISVYSLFPDLVDMLAMKLPSLDQLHVVFTRIVPIYPVDHSVDNNGHLFCLQMRGRSYSEWKLRHFIGRHTAPTIKFQSALRDYEAAIRVAIPHLDTFTVG